jgi:hypothetical protein
LGISGDSERTPSYPRIFALVGHPISLIVLGVGKLDPVEFALLSVGVVKTILRTGFASRASSARYNAG